ncbi:hypothetical protein PPTG_22338 [Phytophthora nicotianae INRA-310]|uniref:Uncharacterized protein n=1 Tax=Phytophthora nicotianae (strain INRA-310) TaxID=761204 RepID=W2QJL1_PHYN3|nr:hypothetical protein PPTG_22338 [Phytophthora nicotianae INRA-310]ETN13342.1 hypothetical protein PPTG_22338 [Phytophthora nicotianae INRA-310]
MLECKTTGMLAQRPGYEVREQKRARGKWDKQLEKTKRVRKHKNVNAGLRMKTKTT